MKRRRHRDLCDPFEVGNVFALHFGGVAPGYFLLPFQGNEIPCPDICGGL
jgi:hypothetical protein